MQAVLRAKVNSAVSELFHPVQLGGKPKQQSSFATVFLKGFLATAKSRRTNVAVLLIDIHNVFYSLIRQTALGPLAPGDDVEERVGARGCAWVRVAPAPHPVQWNQPRAFAPSLPATQHPSFEVPSQPHTSAT